MRRAIEERIHLSTDTESETEFSADAEISDLSMPVGAERVAALPSWPALPKCLRCCPELPELIHEGNRKRGSQPPRC